LRFRNYRGELSPVGRVISPSPPAPPPHHHYPLNTSFHVISSFPSQTTTIFKSFQPSPLHPFSPLCPPCSPSSGPLSSLYLLSGPLNADNPPSSPPLAYRGSCGARDPRLLPPFLLPPPWVAGNGPVFRRGRPPSGGTAGRGRAAVSRPAGVDMRQPAASHGRWDRRRGVRSCAQPLCLQRRHARGRRSGWSARPPDPVGAHGGRAGVEVALAGGTGTLAITGCPPSAEGSVAGAHSRDRIKLKKNRTAGRRRCFARGRTSRYRRQVSALHGRPVRGRNGRSGLVKSRPKASFIDWGSLFENGAARPVHRLPRGAEIPRVRERALIANHAPK